MSVSPEASVVTQNVVEAHETDVKAAPVPIATGAVHELPSNARACPVLSTATQKSGLTHEIDEMVFEVDGLELGSTESGADQPDPFQTMTFPLLSPATQNARVGHETDSSSPTGSWFPGWDHDDPSHMATPPPSVATQKLGPAQAESEGPPQAPTVPDHWVPS